MDHLGEIEGDGELFVDGLSVGDARFHINIWQDGSRGLKSAAGDIWISDTALYRAANSNDVLIVLSDGSNIKIAIQEYFGGLGRAEIIVSGPVPGY